MRLDASPILISKNSAAGALLPVAPAAGMQFPVAQFCTCELLVLPTPAAALHAQLLEALRSCTAAAAAAAPRSSSSS
eukprot:4235597-Lingulodinium_polyedra.AAC.1